MIFLVFLMLFFLNSPAYAATAIPFSINMSEVVNVTGTPRIAVDVGGVTRYADYTSGTGTNALTFTYTLQAGDVDLDGVALVSPIDLNSGTITDLSGNPATLTFTPPDTSGIKANFPSLGMDFVADADGRYTLNGTAYNDLPSFLTATGGSFTRNSIATYYDATGTLQTASANQPRFDHDPVTHAPKGILIEESRTNLLTRSEEFENAAWQKGNATIAPDAYQAPDGTMTAKKIIDNNASKRGNVNVSNNDPSLKTFSCYAKAGEWGFVGIGFTNTTGVWSLAVFDLNSGTYSNTNSYSIPIISSYSIHPVGNGWYRISATITGATNSAVIVPAFAGGDIVNPVWTGDGTSGIYIWGAQLEQGAFPTSYIPTTTAAVTRAADGFTVPIGAWFDTTKGSLYASAISQVNGAGSQILAGLGSFSADSMNFRQTSSPNIYFMGREVGQSPFDGGNTSISLNLVNKISGAYSEGQTRSFSVNGSITSAGIFGVGFGSSYSRLGIGQFPELPPNGLWNGYIQKFKYYPTRVSDTQLQLMTQ